MAMTDDERRAIQQDCIDLQMRYGIYADQGDVEKFTRIFAEDGSVEVPGSPAFVGHDAIRAAIAALAQLPVVGRHVITNPVVDVVDENHATGICYLTVFNSDAEPDETGARPSNVPSTMGEYHDTFTRTANGWRIQSRMLKRVFRRPDDPIARIAAERGGG